MSDQEPSDAQPAVTKTIEHGDASSLPTPVWLWRRNFSFLVSAALLYLTWLVIGKVSDIATLREIARDSLFLVGLVIFVYVAGAAATDVVQLVSAVRTTRRETITGAAA